jgi:hypothetical protein
MPISRLRVTLWQQIQKLSDMQQRQGVVDKGIVRVFRMPGGGPNVAGTGMLAKMLDARAEFDVLGSSIAKFSPRNKASKSSCPLSRRIFRPTVCLRCNCGLSSGGRRGLSIPAAIIVVVYQIPYLL